MGQLEDDIAKLDAMTIIAAHLTRDNDHSESAGCTGWAAKWCPIHGDCTCEKTYGRYDVNGKVQLCPLHGKRHYTSEPTNPHRCRCGLCLVTWKETTSTVSDKGTVTVPHTKWFRSGGTTGTGPR